METNNLTPDENLKDTEGYNPYKDYDEIIHPDFRDEAGWNWPENGMIADDSLSGEEFAETGAVIVFLFTALFIVVVGLLLCYLL